MTKQTLLSVAAVLAAASAAGVVQEGQPAFPLTLGLWNNTWNLQVEPETSTVANAYSVAPLVVRDEDQLVRVLSNIEQLRILNQWTDDGGMHLVGAPDWPEAEPQPDPAAEAARLAAEAQAKAEADALAKAKADEEAEAARLAAEKAEADRKAAEADTAGKGKGKGK